MNRATKRMKAPVTDGVLLTDIRRSTGSFLGKRGANRIKSVRCVLTLLTAAVLLFSFLMTNLPASGRPVFAADSKTRRSKMSSDLENEIVRSPGGMVRVIVDTKTSSNNSAFTRLISKMGGMGGSVSRNLNQGKSVSIQIPASALLALSGDTAINYLSLDRVTKVAGHLESTTGAAAARRYGSSSTGTIDGHGIGIAILDSGVYAAHHAFNGRVVASIDFTDEGRTDDPYGHGTHVASMAAGNSHVSNGAYTGIAPQANIINVRVLDSHGRGSASDTIAGIDWCIANKTLYNIRVLNLSLGTTAIDSYEDDPLCQAVRRAHDAGLVVCAAAGNSGKDANGNKVYGSIHSPGIEPSAITIGATNTFGTDSRADDAVASFSSRGPTRGYYTDSASVRHYDNLIKPDIVAPGNKIIEAESPRNFLLSGNPALDAVATSNPNHRMMTMSGTSMATPVVAGAAALLLQRNPNLTPNLVKAILEYTAQPLAGVSNYEQGAGELNLEGAVRLAKAVRTDLAGRIKGDALLTRALPAPRTTIAGHAFNWGGGILQKWNFVYGSALVTRYQGIYGNGFLLSDGAIVSSGHLMSDGFLLSDGVLLSAGVILSDGFLLSDGILLSDGFLLSDGILLSDGFLLSDGILMSDSTLASSLPPSIAQSLAMSALSGDRTASMQAAPDTDPGH